MYVPCSLPCDPAADLVPALSGWSVERVVQLELVLRLLLQRDHSEDPGV